MKNNALLSTFILCFFILTANAQEHLWPVKGEKAGIHIIYTPQGHLEGERNPDDLFIGGGLGDTIVSPVDGTVTSVNIIYRLYLNATTIIKPDINASWNDAITEIKADSGKIKDVKGKFICGSINLKDKNGIEFEISGLQGDFRFKRGEKIAEGTPIGTMGYSYRTLPEPSISVSISSKAAKPLDVMTAFGLEGPIVKPQNTAPVSKLSRADAKEDYTIYFRALQELYPTFGYLIPEEEQEEYLAGKLKMIDESAKGDSIEYADYLTIIDKDNERIHDSHLTREQPEWSYERNAVIPGIMIGILGDTMYCTNIGEDNAHLLGQPLLQFNGYDTEAARKRMYRDIRAYDADVEAYKNFKIATLGFQPLFDGDPNFDATIMLMDSTLVTINGIGTRKVADPSVDPPPYVKKIHAYLYWSEKRKKISMRMLNDSTAYLDIASFLLDNLQIDSISTFIKSIDTIPNLIVDVQDNKGGYQWIMQKIYSFLSGDSIELGGYLYVNKLNNFASFDYLTENVYIDDFLDNYHSEEGKKGFYKVEENTNRIFPDSLTNYKGRIYMLTNEHSVSAASAFPGLLVRNHRGVTVGRETRNAYHYMTAYKKVRIKLPHSQIVAGIPMVEIMFDTLVNERVPYGRGVLPDYEVSLSLPELWSENGDTILNRALELIDKGEYINYENPFNVVPTMMEEVEGAPEVHSSRFIGYIAAGLLLLLLIFYIAKKR